MNKIKQDVKDIQHLSKTIPLLADALQEMKEYGLTERALIVLAADAAGVGKRHVERIFNSFKKMKRLYVKGNKNGHKTTSIAITS